MVVLLAIAGSVAAVLLTRAGEETSNLEETDSSVYGIENATGCRLGNGEWTDVANAGDYTGLDDDVEAALERAGVNQATAIENTGVCTPG